MTEYKILKEFLDEKKLKLNFILSLPRTRSTALQLALSQSPEINGQINLPINSGNFSRPHDPNFLFGDFRDSIQDVSYEEISCRINQVIQPLIKEEGSANVIVHDHLNFLASKHLPFLLELSENFILCIRHPKVQFLSYIIRMVNEFFLEEDILENSKCFSSQDIIELLTIYSHHPSQLEERIYQVIKNNEIKIHDKNNIWYRFTKCEDYHNISLNDLFIKIIHYIQKELEVSWDNAINTFNFLRTGKKNINIVPVDGDVFAKNSLQVINSIASKINIVPPSITQLNNWSKFTGKNFKCYMSDNPDNSSWNGFSRNSQTISTSNDAVKYSVLEYQSNLPQEFLTSFLKAQDVYQSFFKDNGTA